MKIDFESRRVLLENKTLYLTETENIILELLYNNRNKVVKYNEIIKRVYNSNPDKGLLETVRKHISLLKAKINKYITIKNIRKIGYIIEEELK